MTRPLPQSGGSATWGRLWLAGALNGCLKATIAATPETLAPFAGAGERA